MTYKKRLRLEIPEGASWSEIFKIADAALAAEKEQEAKAPPPPPPPSPGVEYLNFPKLKERGWTKTMVHQFLGTPDAQVPNPFDRNAGAPMRLYQADRVETAERSTDVQAAFAKAESRREAAAKAVATRAANITEACEQAEIEVRVLSYDELKELSLDTHGGNYEGEPGEWYWSLWTARNCARHCCTNYEALWSETNRGETGREGYEVLRERADAAIDEAYPWLRSEEAFEAEGKKALEAAGASGTSTTAVTLRPPEYASERAWPRRVLRRRGWSDDQIERLLGEPDEVGLGPDGNVERRCWDAGRVLAAEEQHGFGRGWRPAPSSGVGGLDDPFAPPPTLPAPVAPAWPEMEREP